MYALRNTQQQARSVMVAEDANRHLGVLKANGVLRMNNRKKITPASVLVLYHSFQFQRKIGQCLRPNWSESRASSFGEVIASALTETDADVSSALTFENIFGVSYPTCLGEM